MAFKFKFHIEEAPDGKSFTLYDITGDYDAVSNPEGWVDYNIVNTAKITLREHMSHDILEFNLTPDATIWNQGIKYEKDDNSFYPDGAYEFKVYINDGVVATRSFGFYAKIKETIMLESLSYRPERERVYKELIWEKMRLLDNLFYATETDQIIHFKENLAQLKKLK